jgi:Zn-dependent protease with chaperone function
MTVRHRLVASLLGVLVTALASAQEADVPSRPATAASGPVSDVFRPLLDRMRNAMGDGSGGATAAPQQPQVSPQQPVKPAPGSQPAQKPVAGSPARPTAPPLTSTGALANNAKAGGVAAVVLPSSKALNELRADRQCAKTEERHDVWAKAAEFAGTNAQMRLTHLVSSDFRHSDLTAQDKQFLKYLAYTTIWIPSSLEVQIGKAYAALVGSSPRDDDSGRSERKALQRIQERASELAGRMEGFPGAVTVSLDRKLAGGAVARPGNLIIINETYLANMDESPEVRDVVLAHELSHLYKRHTVKELQYQLITSASGFSIAKKLFNAVKPGNDGPLTQLGGILMAGQLAIEIVDFVKELQAKYPGEQELEADVCGLRFISIAGVQPLKAWQIFSRLLKASSADGATGYSGVHPSTRERDENIARALAGSGRAGTAVAAGSQGGGTAKQRPAAATPVSPPR